MRRSQLIPWKAAGRVSEQMASGDDVVRQTGWVFNNATGDSLTLAEFVETGDHEVPAYLETFGLRHDDNQHRTLVEIGSGIGRMTCAFTREFGSVVGRPATYCSSRPVASCGRCTGSRSSVRSCRASVRSPVSHGRCRACARTTCSAPSAAG